MRQALYFFITHQRPSANSQWSLLKEQSKMEQLLLCTGSDAFSAALPYSWPAPSKARQQFILHSSTHSRYIPMVKVQAKLTFIPRKRRKFFLTLLLKPVPWAWFFISEWLSRMAVPFRENQTKVVLCGCTRTIIHTVLWCRDIFWSPDYSLKWYHLFDFNSLIQI